MSQQAVAAVKPWQFKPGQSGNPGGKPKGIDVAALARQHTAEAIAALVEALKVPKERVQAAQVLLNRGWGMPLQQIEQHSDSVTLHLVAARAVTLVDHTSEVLEVPRVPVTLDAPVPSE